MNWNSEGMGGIYYLNILRHGVFKGGISGVERVQ